MIHHVHVYAAKDLTLLGISAYVSHWGKRASFQMSGRMGQTTANLLFCVLPATYVACRHASLQSMLQQRLTFCIPIGV